MSSRSRKPALKVLKNANLRVTEFVVDAYEKDIDGKVEKSLAFKDEWKDHPIVVKSNKNLSKQIIKPISTLKKSKCRDDYKILPKVWK